MSSGLTVAFDADDTLWHNEHAFAAAEDWFNELVAPWATPDQAQKRLVEVERDRVALYGYGVKSFALSMIEAAADLSDDTISATSVRQILATAHDLLSMPTALIDGAADVIEAVSDEHRTMIITKGDLHHQQRRLAVADVERHCFDVEVVADKDAATYARMLRRHAIEPQDFVMIGNSMVSDVIPVLEAGGRAIHIPYEVTWALEQPTEDLAENDQWFRLDSITEVPSLLAKLSAR